MGQMGWGGEFGWMRFAGERLGNGSVRGLTATHDRRVARRVMRRTGARWAYVSRHASSWGHRRLYWFHDDVLVRLQAQPGRG